ncbi:MAG: nuclear transport factor 2 family protein [Anaerolineae bacterium]|nr:nuclear transport factor 2 family protein [Anaerolineae bacterium]MDW8098264.1 nuclear transport factor 2 family protein [Anaerolineae bacterium]
MFDFHPRSLIGIWIILVLGLLASCGRSAAPERPPTFTSAPRSSTSTPSVDEIAIRQLLDAEAEAVVEQDIDRLMEIWAEDGEVIDARHTPDQPADDIRWRGKDAIRERYVSLVFPGGPTAVAHPIVDLVISGDTAVVTTTTQIGSETAEAGDRWTFARREGRWVITSLTYNLEPP